jgi:hypothetical protein
MSNGNGKKPTIDERLEALAQSVELLTTDVQALQKQSEATHKHIDTLASVVDKHEHEHQRLRRTMRAALEAYLSDDNGAA